MTEENSTESELIESVTDADSNIRLREAFELFDADKDGEITLDELQKVNNNKAGKNKISSLLLNLIYKSLKSRVFQKICD